MREREITEVYKDKDMKLSANENARKRYDTLIKHEKDDSKDSSKSGDDKVVGIPEIVLGEEMKPESIKS